MKDLLESINNLKKTKIKRIIDNKIKEFENIHKKPTNKIFEELCFCILTANYNAKRAIKIQNNIKNGFLTLPKSELSQRLKKLGHRYPNTRAEYIIEARKHKHYLKKIFNNTNNEYELREWLIKNIKGLGYKEASHFLRNTGYKNLAIIDFHIIDLLIKNKLIKKPKTLTKNKYTEIENKLKELADKSNLTLGELDLYLWYLETKKILK